MAAVHPPSFVVAVASRVRYVVSYTRRLSRLQLVLEIDFFFGVAGFAAFDRAAAFGTSTFAI